MADRQTRATQICHALIAAGLIMGVSFLLRRMTPGVFSADVAERIVGVLMGGILAVYVNVLPKKSQAEVSAACRTDESHAMRRFAGWALTLGGVGCAAAWLLAPIDIANSVSMGLLAVALAVVLGRFFWRTPRPRSS